MKLLRITKKLKILQELKKKMHNKLRARRKGIDNPQQI